MTADSPSCKYVAVTNIPNEFHACDLRFHFSSMIESKSFICFHYRHRPEKEDQTGGHGAKRKCCVVKVLASRIHQLLEHHEVHWTNVKGDTLSEKCLISLVKLKSSHEENDSSDPVEEKTLLAMPEMRPPELMPQGNIGTPTPVFLDFIQRCLLPQSLINKLHLYFPKQEAKRLYACMAFDYGTNKSELSEDGHFGTSNAPDNIKISFNKTLSNKRKRTLNNSTETKASSIRPKRNLPETKFMREESNEKTDSELTEPVFGFALQCVRGVGDCTDPESSGPSQRIQSADIQPPLDSVKDENEQHFVVPASPKESVRIATLTGRDRKRNAKEERRATKRLMDEGIEERLIALDRKYHSEEDAEEWDRHEASEDDPSNQERNKERLYEEEIEQPWEKGGPGVVFYTDAMFWQKREGDFDEQTTDDLDVDFSPYEEEGTGSGDKDIKDFLKIRQETRFRSGYDKTDRFSIGIAKRLEGETISHERSQKGQRRFATDEATTSTSSIGKFERYSKGIGRKVMEGQGWKEGQGLGSSRPGIVHALHGVGQNPHCKRGLGFVEGAPKTYGVKTLSMKNRQAEHGNQRFISTVYDHPETVDAKVPLLQRSEPTTLKHRQSHRDKFL